MRRGVGLGKSIFDDITASTAGVVFEDAARVVILAASTRGPSAIDETASNGLTGLGIAQRPELRQMSTGVERGTDRDREQR